MVVVPGGVGQTLLGTFDSELLRITAGHRVVQYVPCGVGRSKDRCSRRTTFEEIESDAANVMMWALQSSGQSTMRLLCHSFGCLISARILRRRAHEFNVSSMIWVAPMIDYDASTRSVSDCLSDRLLLPSMVTNVLPSPIYSFLRFSVCGSQCVQRSNVLKWITCSQPSLRGSVSVVYDGMQQRLAVESELDGLAMPTCSLPQIYIAQGNTDYVTPASTLQTWIAKQMLSHPDTCISLRICTASHFPISEDTECVKGAVTNDICRSSLPHVTIS